MTRDQIRRETRMIAEQAETFEDLKEMNREIKDAWTALSRKLAANAQVGFRVGDKVEFVKRNGFVVRGTVDKILQKNILISEDDGLFKKWRVHPSYLKKI